MNLLGPHSNSIRQEQMGVAIIQNNISLTCITMIGPSTGWFEISKVMTYDLDEIMVNNYEYIDK